MVAAEYQGTLDQKLFDRYWEEVAGGRIDPTTRYHDAQQT